MSTYAIPPNQWRTALDTFSLTHRGWPVTVEVLSPLMGAQPEVLELPLSGISLNSPDQDPAVAVCMSRRQPEHLTHLVEHVSQIYVDHEAGDDTAIEVVASDGTRTLLRFSRPTVDIEVA